MIIFAGISHGFPPKQTTYTIYTPSVWVFWGARQESEQENLIKHQHFLHNKQISFFLANQLTKQPQPQPQKPQQQQQQKQHQQKKHNSKCPKPT